MQSVPVKAFLRQGRIQANKKRTTLLFEWFIHTRNHSSTKKRCTMNYVIHINSKKNPVYFKRNSHKPVKCTDYDEQEEVTLLQKAEPKSLNPKPSHSSQKKVTQYLPETGARTKKTRKTYRQRKIILLQETKQSKSLNPKPWPQRLKKNKTQNCTPRITTGRPSKSSEMARPSSATRA